MRAGIFASAVGMSRPPSNYLGLQYDGTNLSSYSFSAGPSVILPEHPDRRIVVAIVGRGGTPNSYNPPTSITIGGITATVDAVGNTSDNLSTVVIASASFPTGDEPSVVINSSASMSRSSVCMFSLMGTKFVAVTAANGSPDSISMPTVTAGMNVIAVATHQFTSSNNLQTWSAPMTKHTNTTIESTTVIAAASTVATGAVSFTVAYSEKDSTGSAVAAVAYS